MKRLAIGLMAGALVLTACQSASETLTEQALEQIEGVDGVDIDVDSGEVSLETDEGKITIGGGEVPDDFGIPLPGGDYEVLSVFTSDDSSTVSLAYPGADYDTIVAHFEDWTSGQPEEWSVSTSSVGAEDGQTIKTTTFSGDAAFITVSNFCLTLNEDIGEFEAICVTAVDA
jgi:copper chaperone CopZ